MIGVFKKISERNMGAKASTTETDTAETTTTAEVTATSTTTITMGSDEKPSKEQEMTEGDDIVPPSGDESKLTSSATATIEGSAGEKKNDDKDDDDDEVFMAMLRSGYEGGGKVRRTVSESAVLSKTTLSETKAKSIAPLPTPTTPVKFSFSFLDIFRSKTTKKSKDDDASSSAKKEETKDKKEDSKAETSKQQEATSESSVAKSIFSLPYLGILQGIFMLTLIGQQFPALERTWPFSLLHHGPDGPNSSGDVVTPMYAELRKDMYGHYKQFPDAIKRDPMAEANPLLHMLLSGPPKPPPPKIPTNTGIPKQEFIHITNINHEYESFRYSVQAATTSKAQAAIELRQTSFQRALSKTLSRLTDLSDVKRLIMLESKFLKDASKLIDKLVILRSSSMCNITTESTDNDTSATSNEFLDTEICTKYAGVLSKLNKDAAASNITIDNATCANNTLDDDIINGTVSSNDTKIALTNVTAEENIILNKDEIREQIYDLGNNFLKQITQSLEPGPGNAIRDALEGHAATQGFEQVVKDLQHTSMASRFSSLNNNEMDLDDADDDDKNYMRSLLSSNSLLSKTIPHKRLFVTYFEGDMMASEVSQLRKEVTAIVRSAVPSHGDEVLVVLQSGGGTVTGYGLVAGQLLRLKEAGLKLTIAVEQVAASGGYMAACVGHNIICSPFAVVGSIGVVTEMPNIYERLQREGVKFVEVTAGEYKRVLSPTRNITDKDLVKARAEMEDVWILFKDFVSEHRPTLDIQKVGTGEIWFGQKAVDVGLCDSIRAADDILLDYVSRGYDVYKVKYKEPSDDKFEQLLEEWLSDLSSSNMLGGFFNDYQRHGGGSFIRWFQKKGLPKLFDLFGGSKSNNNDAVMRYRAEDDPRQRFLMI